MRRKDSNITFFEDAFFKELSDTKRLTMMKKFLLCYELYSLEAILLFKSIGRDFQDSKDFVIHAEGLVYFKFPFVNAFFLKDIDPYLEGHFEFSVAVLSRYFKGKNTGKELTRYLFSIMKLEDIIDPDHSGKALNIYQHVYGDDYDPQSDPTPTQEDYKKSANFDAYNFYLKNSKKSLRKLCKEVLNARESVFGVSTLYDLNVIEK